MPSMIIVDGVSVPKSEVDWIDVEEQASVGNARAFNTIFNDVDLNVFKLINSCSTAKEAWKILEVAYEGTTKVKISILQLVISKFEALKMSEEEFLLDYNKRVLEIANESLLLGEKIPKSKIVRKVLRSLPEKFDMKITTIKEAHDITKLILDELFRSLLTFEMTISHRENKKGKGIAFKSIYEEETLVNQYDNEANMNASIALLTKQFAKVVKKTECPMFFRRKKKNFHATLSDEDTDDSEEEDNNMNAFTVRIIETNSRDESENSEENYDNKLTFEELKVM
ncbi:gag-pol polyprotein [Cucumis melo var. makuwa]|uniref:Gag-pol polyprotein n=1 Tax=Cucumis melo var. makuwa TaxID=1194695 RepID=A0A5A7SR43_CUCMM|nr:gag-pol polyprotein [Cucumis melo var. makuwa]